MGWGGGGEMSGLVGLGWVEFSGGRMTLGGLGLGNAHVGR